MPYADHEKGLIHRRDHIRTKRYGNWRQVYVDCDGMCIGVEEDGSICGEVENLEFHEEFGEDGSRVKVILLCQRHHQKVEGKNVTINPRYYNSRLQEDVDREIEECGSYEAWKSKYHLI